MTDLRKAAEMALEALETLWDILDDIDTTSDIAKENDAWYRKRVEFLQKKRWDTSITTDGYKLKGGVIEALRQALAQPEQEPFIYVREDNEKPFGGYEHCSEADVGAFPVYTAPVDAVNMSQERVDETVKREHEPVAWADKVGAVIPHSHKLFQPDLLKDYTIPLYTTPVPKRKRSIAEDIGRLLNSGKAFYDDGTPIDPEKIQLKMEGIGDGVVTFTEVLIPRPPKKEWVGLDGEIPGLGLVTEEFYNGMIFAEDILREKNGG